MRVECSRCGMPYDLPDDLEAETHLCDCGKIMQIEEDVEE